MAIEQPGSRERHRKLTLPNGTAEVWLENAGAKVNMHVNTPTTRGGGDNWQRCTEHGCLGEAVIAESKCLAHVDANAQRKYLETSENGIYKIRLRGVELNSALIEIIMNSPAFSQDTVPAMLSLQGSYVPSRIYFRDLSFEYAVGLDYAIFEEGVVFNNCVLKRNLSMRFAFLKRAQAALVDSKFHAGVDVSFAHSDSVAIGVSRSEFFQPVKAEGIDGSLHCNDCHFRSDIHITDANAKHTVIEECILDKELRLDGTSCVIFRTSFLRAARVRQIGPLDVAHDCSFNQAQFATRVSIEVSAKTLNLSGARFVEGGDISVKGARIDLTQVSTTHPLRISGPVTTNAQEPTIVSLTGADAGHMTFAHLDMRRTVFYGAHDLKDVVIEPTVKFARPPAWCAKRHCIADEFAWRLQARSLHSWGWRLSGARVASDLPQTSDEEEKKDLLELPALQASQVAAVYRDLRRSFEAKSDQPGAADFYYGEMEMRRQSKKSAPAERAIIFLYWILSGYGLRAWRAFSWFAALILGSAFIMRRSGFSEGPKTFTDGLIFSLKSALPGVQGAEKLTIAGDLVNISLTLLGPLLFALGLLALRGRVKR